MVKTKIEFLQPAARIVVGIWSVYRAEQLFLIAKSGQLFLLLTLLIMHLDQYIF